MRKKDETLRQTLLDLARETVDAQGPESLNIRTLAKKAGVSSGTVYNYFTGKDDILLALTEEHWQKTLLAIRQEVCTGSFSVQLSNIYTYLKIGMNHSAGILMGSLNKVKDTGRRRMQSMQNVLHAALIERMEGDKSIRQGVWNDTLTQEQFADFIIMNMMVYLRVGADTIDTFIEIVNRILY